MQLNLKTTGDVILSDELRAFIDEKLVKLNKLVDSSDTTALMEIELGKAMGGQRTGAVHRAEINLQCKEGLIRAEATEELLHLAIDQAILEARTELRNVRGKHRDLVRRGALKVKKFLSRFKGS